MTALSVLHLFGAMERGGAELRTLDVVHNRGREQFALDLPGLREIVVVMPSVHDRSFAEPRARRAATVRELLTSQRPAHLREQLAASPFALTTAAAARSDVWLAAP